MVSKYLLENVLISPPSLFSPLDPELWFTWLATERAHPRAEPDRQRLVLMAILCVAGSPHKLCLMAGMLSKGDTRKPVSSEKECRID